jgi:uncharacterized membrane protein
VFPWLHPSIVHFAIGLVFAGVALDVVALLRSDEKMQFAGFWNTVLGGVATLLAVLTGLNAEGSLGAHSRMGEALLQFHKLSGIAAALGCVVMLGARVYMRGLVRPRTRTAYLTVSFLTLAFVFLAGGFGGSLVYRYGLGIGPETARAVLEAQAPHGAAKDP